MSIILINPNLKIMKEFAGEKETHPIYCRE